MNAVLITGASTGIGAACALALDKRGYRVFAGVRRAADGEALRQHASPNVRPLLLDVTDAASIAEAARLLQSESGDALAGLVNNAGIAVAGPLEFVSPERLRQQFEVNVVGVLALTQALLPLLRKGPGRIVNISSVSGRLASPFVGPYCASKFALEALSDSLRVELSPWRIPVSVVEPGVINTPIWQKSLASNAGILDAMPAESQALYGREVAAMQAFARSAKGLEPEAVARVVTRALTAVRPKTRYVVGVDARLGVLLSRLPDRMRDWVLLNRLRQLGKR
ncbi:MAG: SDR family oxidoreductase [Cytophagales bacterium]|nr:SDR family oxidoreductase [Cytophagales bacterium]